VKARFLEWLDEQHGYGQHQGALTSGHNMSTDKKCNYQKYIECCENNAINKDGASESCVTAGCTSKRCKLMEEKIHDKKKKKEKNTKENINEAAILDELCSPEESTSELILLTENSNLFGKDFLEVIGDYTIVKPKMAGLVLNATDASNVASCSVNRFMDKASSTAFSCEKYDVLDCANNEDIWAPDTDALCQTSSPSSAPSSAPSSEPSSSNFPTSSFLPTGSHTTAEPTKRPVISQICSSNSDCVSKKCAFESQKPDSPLICCRSGSTISLYMRTFDGWPTNGFRDFCNYQPSGTYCGQVDGICASNVCVFGQCTREKVKNGNLCIVDNDCLSKECSYSSFDPSAELTCCKSGIAKSIWTETTDGWPSDKSRSFCMYQVDGTSCGTVDSLCESGACVGGICTTSKRANDEECTIDNDCLSDKCSYSSFSPSSRLKCCSSGNSITLNTNKLFGWPSSEYRHFCAGQKDGTLCGDKDLLCSSNACVNGRCSPSKLVDLSSCAIDNSCVSNACALEFYGIESELKCCPSGAKQKIYTKVSDGWPTSADRYFCSYQPVGTLCHDNKMCDSEICVQCRCEFSKIANDEFCSENADCVSGSCAYKEFNSSSPKICCWTGDAATLHTRIEDGWSTTQYRSFCKSQPNGSSCGSDDALCMSNACFEGRCAPEKKADNQECISNNECQSAHCAYSSFDHGSPKICCSKWLAYSYKDFCKNRPENTTCGVLDGICEGDCQDGRCTSVRIHTLSPTTQEHSQSPSLSPTKPKPCISDSDCSTSCGYDFFGSEATLICCPSTAAKVLTSSNDGWPSSGYRYFCKNRGDDTICGTQGLEIDDICSSGMCVNGLCSETKIENEESCIRDNNCISGNCGYQHYSPDASLVCCPSGKAAFLTSTSDGWPSTENRYFCTQQSLGYSCGTFHDICASAACVMGQCVHERKDHGEICMVSSDCKSNRCVYSFYGPDATLTCCLTEHYVSLYTDTSLGWSSREYWPVCQRQPLGTLCGTSDFVCESNSCVSGKCSPSKVFYDEECHGSGDCMADSPCAFESFSPHVKTVCCASGKDISLQTTVDDGWHDTRNRRFCTDRELGTSCGQHHGLCLSNACVGGKCTSSKLKHAERCSIDGECLSSKCGFESFRSDAKMICCASTESVLSYAKDGWPFTDYRKFCSDLTLGTYCGISHQLCASKACVREKCAQSKLSNGSTCATHSECSSAKCAYESFDISAPLVCCSHTYVSLDTNAKDGWPYSSPRLFCNNRELGISCGVHGNLCASNACVGGKCSPSKLLHGEVCSMDTECFSGSCARESFEPTAPTVCCPEKYITIATYPNVGWPSTLSRKFCTDRPLGTSCGVFHDLCISNSCVGGKCELSRIQNGEVCSLDSDCFSSKCGLESFSFDAENICCATGTVKSIYTYARDGWNRDGSRYFCSGLLIGTQCGLHDSLCMSGACIFGKCSISKVNGGGECIIDNDCIDPFKCAYESFSPNAPRVCCSHGVTTITTYPTEGWPFKDARSFCMNQPLNTTCGTNDRICASSACVNGSCVTYKLFNSEECKIGNDCQSGQCHYETEDPLARLVCCKSRKSIYTYDRDGWPSTGIRYFCSD